MQAKLKGMDPTERLHIAQRETVLRDTFQRVDVLALTEMVTFRTQTMRGFTLKASKGKVPAYTNRANVTAVTVSPNRLIVVHVRSAVHISGEVPEGKHKALLLQSLTEAEARSSGAELSLLMCTRIVDAHTLLAEPAPASAPQPQAASETHRRKKPHDGGDVRAGKRRPVGRLDFFNQERYSGGVKLCSWVGNHWFFPV